MDHFGDAGTPAIQFDLKLCFGYRVTVAVWENRDLLNVGSGIAIDRRRWLLDGATNIQPKRRRLAYVHFALSSITEEVLAHELFHVLYELRRRLQKRLRNSERLEECLAREMGRSFTALKSHIAEEKRLLAS